MPQVQAVLGPVDASALGRVLMHEHVFVLTADVQQNYPDEWGSEDDRVADAVARLRGLAAAGITTIVDVTVIGQGRYIPRIARIAGHDVLPYLRDHGVSDADIDAMLVGNPARILAG
jgi:phosphotriesterase-related protein